MDARNIAPSQQGPDGEEALYRPKPDGSINPIGETGWFLQRERERRGETLEQASETTGIHVCHLSAIESGDMSGLPQRDEALHMVGVYALHMGFEAEPLMSHYARYLPIAPASPRHSHPADPSPLSSAKVIKFGKLSGLFGPKLTIPAPSLPGGAGGIIVSCLAAVILFAGASWMMQPAAEMTAGVQTDQSSDTIETSSIDRDPADVTIKDADMPDDGNSAASVLPGGQPAVGVDPASGRDAGAGLEGLTALIEQSLDEMPKPAGKLSTPKAKPVPAQANQPVTPAQETAASRLVLKSKAPVWIRIEDSQGSVVMTRMLMPGDSYKVPDREGLVVIARDGGLLLYEIDGKEQGVLGTPGEILVGRSLDLKSLEKRG